jgi:hypothetical protein
MLDKREMHMAPRHGVAAYRTAVGADDSQNRTTAAGAGGRGVPAGSNLLPDSMTEATGEATRAPIPSVDFEVINRGPGGCMFPGWCSNDQ